MRHKIRFFRQHTMETCGISCILMTLDAFHKVKYPTKKQEIRLYGIYKCRAFKGVLGSAIAECLSKNGIKVTLYHSSPRFLENRDEYYPKELYEAILNEYTETINHIRGNMDIMTECEITSEMYRKMLDDGKMLIVQCIVPGDADGMHKEVLHWILLYGYDGDVFYACDPLSSKIELTETEMHRYTDTPVGHICIGVTMQNS